MPVTKSDIARRVAEKMNLPHSAAREMMDIAIETVKSSLEEGEEVRLAGLGTFLVVTRAPKKGRNPQTGEIIQVPAKNAVKFRPVQNVRKTIAATGY